MARLTGPPRRASTVALVALVGTQLGQTLLVGGRQPLVVLTGVGSAVVLAGLVQTPGVSRFFGCTPLGPVGWATATGCAVAATVASARAPHLFERLVPAWPTADDAGAAGAPGGRPPQRSDGVWHPAAPSEPTTAG